MVVLEPLEAAALICVFEDAVLQLNILSTLDGDRGRAGATARPIDDETDLGLSDRIRRQRVRIKIMFERLMGRMAVSADIGSLINDDPRSDNVCGYDEDDEETGRTEAEKVTEARRQLAETEEEIANAKATIAEQDAIIARLKDEDRLGNRVDLAQRHVTKSWAAARLQVLQRTHCLREDSTRRLSEDTRIGRRREGGVHSQVTAYLQEVTADLQKQTESWEDRYRTQAEQWDARLKKLRSDKEQHASRLSCVADELGRRTEFCSAVLQVREQRKLAAETRKRQNEAAIRIQAWWRGHMVRRGFGAFRRKQKQKQQKHKEK